MTTAQVSQKQCAAAENRHAGQGPCDPQPIPTLRFTRHRRGLPHIARRAQSLDQTWEPTRSPGLVHLAFFGGRLTSPRSLHELARDGIDCAHTARAAVRLTGDRRQGGADGRCDEDNSPKGPGHDPPDLAQRKIASGNRVDAAVSAGRSTDSIAGIVEQFMHGSSSGHHLRYCARARRTGSRTSKAPARERLGAWRSPQRGGRSAGSRTAQESAPARRPCSTGT